MTKNEQRIENRYVEAMHRSLMRQIRQYIKRGRLRTCNAEVFETPDFFFLQSYATIVACIDKRDGEKIDFLRYVYGYSATSAQHISKFFEDYGDANKPRLTWREI